MKWTKFLILLGLLSCGERETLNQIQEKQVEKKPENEQLEDVQQNPYDLDDRLIMVASKKNGGEEGSVFFDSEYEAPEKYHLELPQIIQASGSPGNGQKLYILFNSTIDCMWASHADEDYRDPACYQNAERAPGTVEGFEGGEKLEITDLEEVEKIEMHVNGAEGDGVLTTASAILLKL